MLGITRLLVVFFPVCSFAGLAAGSCCEEAVRRVLVTLAGAVVIAVATVDEDVLEAESNPTVWGWI